MADGDGADGLGTGDTGDAFGFGETGDFGFGFDGMSTAAGEGGADAAAAGYSAGEAAAAAVAAASDDGSLGGGNYGSFAGSAAGDAIAAGYGLASGDFGTGTGDAFGFGSSGFSGMDAAGNAVDGLSGFEGFGGGTGGIGGVDGSAAAAASYADAFNGAAWGSYEAGTTAAAIANALAAQGKNEAFINAAIASPSFATGFSQGLAVGIANQAAQAAQMAVQGVFGIVGPNNPLATPAQLDQYNAIIDSVTRDVTAAKTAQMNALFGIDLNTPTTVSFKDWDAVNPPALSPQTQTVTDLMGQLTGVANPASFSMDFGTNPAGPLGQQALAGPFGFISQSPLSQNPLTAQQEIDSLMDAPVGPMVDMSTFTGRGGALGPMGPSSLVGGPADLEAAAMAMLSTEQGLQNTTPFGDRGVFADRGAPDLATQLGMPDIGRNTAPPSIAAQLGTLDISPKDASRAGVQAFDDPAFDDEFADVLEVTRQVDIPAIVQDINEQAILDVVSQNPAMLAQDWGFQARGPQAPAAPAIDPTSLMDDPIGFMNPMAPVDRGITVADLPAIESPNPSPEQFSQDWGFQQAPSHAPSVTSHVGSVAPADISPNPGVMSVFGPNPMAQTSPAIDFSSFINPAALDFTQFDPSFNPFTSFAVNPNFDFLSQVATQPTNLGAMNPGMFGPNQFADPGPFVGPMDPGPITTSPTSITAGGTSSAFTGDPGGPTGGLLGGLADPGMGGISSDPGAGNIDPGLLWLLLQQQQGAPAGPSG